jgi:hypothetical protein
VADLAAGPRPRRPSVAVADPDGAVETICIDGFEVAVNRFPQPVGICAARETPDPRRTP